MHRPPWQMHARMRTLVQKNGRCGGTHRPSCATSTDDAVVDLVSSTIQVRSLLGEKAYMAPLGAMTAQHLQVGRSGCEGGEGGRPVETALMGTSWAPEALKVGTIQSYTRPANHRVHTLQAAKLVLAQFEVVLTLEHHMWVLHVIWKQTLMGWRGWSVRGMG